LKVITLKWWRGYPVNMILPGQKVFTFNYADQSTAGSGGVLVTSTWSFNPQTPWRLISIKANVLKTAVATGLTTIVPLSDIVLTGPYLNMVDSFIPTAAGEAANVSRLLFAPGSPKHECDIILSPGQIVTVTVNGYDTFVINDSFFYIVNLEWIPIINDPNISGPASSQLIKSARGLR